MLVFIKIQLKNVCVSVPSGDTNAKSLACYWVEMKLKWSSITGSVRDFKFEWEEAV